MVPTVGLTTATWIPGTPAHSWQAAACGGKDMAVRATILASKALAYTAIDLFLDPTLIMKAKEELKIAKGDYQYKALLGQSTSIPAVLQHRSAELFEGRENPCSDDFRGETQHRFGGVALPGTESGQSFVSAT